MEEVDKQNWVPAERVILYSNERTKKNKVRYVNVMVDDYIDAVHETNDLIPNALRCKLKSST